LGKRLLTGEETRMIQHKYLPAINKEYRDVVRLFALVAERQALIDGEELYLSAEDQRVLLRRIKKNLRELEASVRELMKYFNDVAKRVSVD